MERATVSRLALLQLPLAVPDPEEGERERGREGGREGERERCGIIYHETIINGLLSFRNPRAEYSCKELGVIFRAVVNILSWSVDVVRQTAITCAQSQHSAAFHSPPETHGI